MSGGASNKTYERGLVPGYRDVWLNRNSPANMINLSWEDKPFKVTFSSQNRNNFAVHTARGIIFFVQYESELYY